jgi:hypothetical protein
VALEAEGEVSEVDVGAVGFYAFPMISSFANTSKVATEAIWAGSPVGNSVGAIGWSVSPVVDSLQDMTGYGMAKLFMLHKRTLMMQEAQDSGIR